MPEDKRGATASPRDTALIVENRDAVARQIARLLRGEGLDAQVTRSASEGLDALHTLRPDVVLVGLGLEDVAGPHAVDVFVQRAGDAPVIALSDTDATASVVTAVRRGAVDFIVLPQAADDVAEVVLRALSEARSSRQLNQVREDVADRYGFRQLLSQSPRMLNVFDQIRRVAGTDATVLIQGETGTGKELVSRAIHERSRRRDQPFISVNCGAFAESLLESELFGHERGSFTGAVGRREGLFEMANGGTLFLDELGETTLNVQVSLLRVLEEMSFRRVGGRDRVRVDVRIVAATNADLQEDIARGRFREDLFYRLNVYPVVLPPLRRRREDIPLLMRHFLEEISGEYEMASPTISAGALQAILDYRWPGNVRQLRAMCERWVITCEGKRLELEHLPAQITGRRDVQEELDGFHVDDGSTLKANTDRATAEVERAYLFQSLRRHHGHLVNTAAAAGISRRTLYTKLRALGLDADTFRGKG